MPADLSTTNLLLGIIAAVSVVEVIAFVGLCVGIALPFRRVARAVEDIEAKHIGPTAARVNGILDDAKAVTATVRDETTRLAGIVHWVGEICRRRKAC